MSSDAVTLDDLAAAAVGFSPRLEGRSVPIADLHHDSRFVGPGEGFVAIVGEHADGHDYVDEAIARGAAAAVVERPVSSAVPQLVVADTRRALPVLAATVHGRPSRSLLVAGITGTNGKTTVAHMIEAIAAASGRTAGMVGTVGARIAGDDVPLARTTPEATDLQRLLRRMVEAGVEVAALEVSSHALVLGRADAIEYDVVAFTNLSQDHLDFHGSMSAYAAAKASLFTTDRARRAVIWTDDPTGAEIAAGTSLPVTSVGFSDACALSGRIVELDTSGSVVEMSWRGEHSRMTVPLAGRFNAANALVAAACALELGIDHEAVAAGLRGLDVVPGRFERVDRGQDYTVVVDYAHTPEAIAEIIKTARQLTDGRVLVVAGAGGDRDRAKRPQMGAAAATADVAVITSDNPRSEDPLAIIDAVVSGIGGDRAVLVEPDRTTAISRAIGQAETGDVVLILGKGHETGQETAGVVAPFDDREVAAAAIAFRSQS